MSAAAAVDLSSSVVDLERVRDRATRSLLKAIDAVDGRKALVIDPRLRSTLATLVPQMSALRDRGVDRLYSLDGGQLDLAECADLEIVFLVRPRPELMHRIADVVKRAEDERERASAERKLRDASVTGGSRRRDDEDAAGDEDAPRRFTVCFTPRRGVACDEVLKQLGVHDALVFGRVAAIDFLPLERDVLSLEHENAWRDLAVEGDITPVYYVARALHQLQKVTGEAPLVKGKGTYAKEVAEVVERLRREAHVDEARRLDAWSDEDLPDDELFESSSSSDENSEDDDEDSRGFADHLPPIDFGGFPKGPPRRAGAAFRSKHTPVTPRVDMIVLLDRAVDVVTPLCTQLTYEGLIDEIVGFGANGAVEVEDDDGKAVKARLNGADALFGELRDLNFGRACEALREKSSAMQEEYRSVKRSAEDDVSTQKVSEIGGFVRKIKDNMRGVGLDLHATIAKHLLDRTRGAMLYQRRFARVLDFERICLEGRDFEAAREHVETTIYRGENVRRCARALALATVCFGGIPKKYYDQLRRDMHHAHGPAVLVLMQHMEAARLLFRREDEAAGGGVRRGFPATKRAFELVDNDPGEDQQSGVPGDVSYAYGATGYAPLTARLARRATEGSWKKIDEHLRKLAGPHFEYAQGWDDAGRPAVLAANHAGFEAKRNRARKNPREAGRKPVVLVCFVGGVTRAEISCLRFLGARDDVGAEFLVAATKIENGFGMMDALIDNQMNYEPLDRGIIDRDAQLRPAARGGRGGASGSGGGGGGWGSTSGAEDE